MDDGCEVGEFLEGGPGGYGCGVGDCGVEFREEGLEVGGGGGGEEVVGSGCEGETCGFETGG